MPTKVADKLLVWGSDIEPGTIEQAARSSRLPFVPGHIALMPDAHVGMGATVGSVIPTERAIMPAAVGVDIGCGMVASETDLTAEDLPDTLDPLLGLIGRRVPAGVGKGHTYGAGQVDKSYDALGRPHTELTGKQADTAALQFGTLGSGNHFIEVCLDERGTAWTVLHSGSRGIGNQLATRHISAAKGLMRERFISLEDPDLAYLVEGEPSFDAYVTDMLWAQDYAMGSRAVMAAATTRSLLEVVGHGRVVRTINCHHNFTQREHHLGRDLWITRKGAIQSRVGDLGVIPGSMGTGTYIVEGKGVAASYASCSHGAGRRMSRGQARRTLTTESLVQAMAGKTWLDRDATALLDEHPDSYKDISQVMADQQDLVTVVHRLTQVLNYKGL